MLSVRSERQGFRARGCQLITRPCSWWIRRLPGLVLGIQLALSSLAQGGELAGRERCRHLIQIFDQIVQSRFDHRHLMIDEEALADARAMREQAVQSCREGEYWLGAQAIEDALSIIGYLPKRLGGPGKPALDRSTSS